MPLQRPVNDRQLKVLRRIVEGHKPVSSAEPELATTVYALRARGLIETKRSDGGWTVLPTDVGIFYLQHERYPARQAVSSAPARPTARRPPTRQATRAAVEQAPAPVAVTSTVTVPSHLRAAHPTIAATRKAAEALRPDKTGRLRLRAAGLVELRVSRTALARALRLLQGLVAAAEARGWSLAAARHAPGVALGDGQHAVTVAVVEETDRTPHVLTAWEEREAAARTWFSPPRYDHRPTGRLRLELPNAYAAIGRRRNWRDTSRKSLEQQLPEVLTELAGRLEAAEDFRQKLFAEEAFRQQRAAAARAQATEAFLLDFRRTALRRQSQDWELARKLRAVLAHVGTDEAKASAEWRAPAAAYADALDPPGRRLELPADPPVTDGDLTAYLPRRSPWAVPPRSGS